MGIKRPALLSVHKTPSLIKCNPNFISSPPLQSSSTTTIDNRNEYSKRHCNNITELQQCWNVEICIRWFSYPLLNSADGEGSLALFLFVFHCRTYSTNFGHMEKAFPNYKRNFRMNKNGECRSFVRPNHKVLNYYYARGA